MKQLVVLLAGLLIAASGHAADSKPAQRLRLIFITTCLEEDFFKPVKKGMADAAAQLGVDCTFTGTVGVDVKAQAEMVRQAIRDRYDGIALNLIDPVAFDAVVREAMSKGIPVVAFNVDDYGTPNARLSAVCQKYYDAGRMLGKEFSKSIPEKSHVLMTMHAEGVSALDDRLRGAQDELKTKAVTWTVAITGNTAAEATEVIARELKKHPEIRFVVSTGQADTEGAALAIARDFAGRGVVAAGFDLSPAILKHIKSGHLRFTIDQQPYIQGFYPVVQLTLLKRYGIMPCNMDAGATIVSRDQVDKVMRWCEQGYR